MAWGARQGLKPCSNERVIRKLQGRLNGLGSPSGIETTFVLLLVPHFGRLNGLGSPSGIETYQAEHSQQELKRLNGLGSPSGIETF